MRLLVKEKEDLLRQIKQLTIDHERLKHGSSEKLALETTIASLRVSFCKVQQKVLDIRLKALMLKQEVTGPGNAKF